MARWIETEHYPIRVTARGEWLHGAQRLHPRVESLFRRNIEPTEDGRYHVVLGFNRHALEVDDTPFFVRSLSISKDPATGEITAVTLSTSDDKTEALDPATLMQSSDNVLYCSLRRNGMLVPCRFQPGQYHDLALHAEMLGDNATFHIGTTDFLISRYDPTPRRVS